MDLRLTFNEVTEEYDRLRPKYPDILSVDLIQYSALDKTKKALEIGIGTGQATLPFLKTGCELTAIELGDKLAEFSKKKFREYERFKVMNQDFETASLEENNYDIIYSASAFHWISPEIGLPKVYRLLKSGGVFAWFSGVFAASQKNMYDEIQKVYSEYKKYFNYEAPQFDRTPEAQSKLMDISNKFKQYGFTDIFNRLYCGSRTLNAKDYATLCGTYSDHRVIPEPDRVVFLQKLEDTINLCGGTFTFTDTFLLCMGKKPWVKHVL